MLFSLRAAAVKKGGQQATLWENLGQSVAVNNADLQQCVGCHRFLFGKQSPSFMMQPSHAVTGDYFYYCHFISRRNIFIVWFIHETDESGTSE